MAVSKNNYKIKFKSFCDKYIALDSNGELDFKSYLKRAINDNSILKDDARLISLELMYNLKEYNLNPNKIDDEVKDLIKKVKDYNSNGEISSKMGVLFFKDYSHEEKFLLEYINGPSVNLEEKEEISNPESSTDFKDILNNLSKVELCYILDLNPELNFEKEKQLKNRITDKYSNYPIDVNKLENASCKEIKKYLFSLSNNETEDISKKEEKESVSDNREISTQISDKIESDKERRIRLAKIRQQENIKFLEEQRRKIKKRKKPKSVVKPESSQKNIRLKARVNKIESQPKNMPLGDIVRQNFSKINNQKIDRNIKEIDNTVISQKTKPDVSIQYIAENHNQKRFSSANLNEYQLKSVSAITEAIKDGYKYIIFEASDGFGKSAIALTLANMYKSSLILKANEQLKNQFIKRFKNKIDSDVSVCTYYEFLKNQDSDNEKLLIMEEAHILDQFVVNYLENEYDEGASFKIDDYVKENIFNNAEICIFIGSAILNPKQFIKEFDIEESEVKYIHADSSFEFKNKIHTRNSVNMKSNLSFESKPLAIPIIRDILDKHKNDRGIIFAGNSELKNYIIRNIGGIRLLDTDYKPYEKIRRFNTNTNNVLICSSVDDYLDLPTEKSRFQIFFRQPMPLWDDRAKLKDYLDSNWYNYKKATDIVPMLENNMRWRHDFCDIYIVDERFQFFIINDMEGPNFIPEHIRDSIVDMDLKDWGNVSKNIKKKYGVYYMYDYIPDNSSLQSNRLSKEIQNYKDYQYDSPRFNEEFEFFTNEVMKAVSEFSQKIIGLNIDRIALVAIPSSTLERDKYNSMRSTINLIEDYYKSGKLKSQFGCKKDIVNCSDLLVRIRDVKTSHSDNRRSYYCEHIDSIKCHIDKISDLNNTAFIILDDIATRGTIMNACEDILIRNNVNKEHIYKFALFKTVGVENDKI